MSDVVEGPETDGAGAPRRTSIARAPVRVLVGAAAASAFLWAYQRVGAGAAGVGGLALLLAPAALLVFGFFVMGPRRFMRPGWASLVLGAALPYVLASSDLEEWTSRRPFDPVAWKVAAGGRSQDRIRQVDALIASGRLDRVTLDSVLDLLGPDDSAAGTGWGRGYLADRDLVYWLGDERGFISIDSEWLVLRFDDAGVAREYRIVRD